MPHDPDLIQELLQRVLSPAMPRGVVKALAEAGREQLQPNPVLPPNIWEGMKTLAKEDPSILRTGVRMDPSLEALAGVIKGPRFSRTIRVSPALTTRHPEQVADTLLHELTHVRQGAVLDEDLPYGQRPSELEAFQTQRNRQLRQGRAVPLNTYPGFLAASTSLGDILLHPEAQTTADALKTSEETNRRYREILRSYLYPLSESE